MLISHRAVRADSLVAGLADLLNDPLPDPLAVEVVSVPARGVERWVAQQLSLTVGAANSGPCADGICANVAFPHPNELVAQVVATVTDVDAAEDPWAKGRLVWPLLTVIDGQAEQLWCRELAGFIGLLDEAGKRVIELQDSHRYAVAHRLAGLFDSYADQRPDMMRAWLDGRPEDGTGRKLAEDLLWQPQLLRELRLQIGSPSPAELLPEALEKIRNDPAALTLPSRVSIFGPTRLSMSQRLVIDALAVERDVHLWLPHPSPALWHKVAGQIGSASPSRRAEGESVRIARNPLLQSLGRDTTEMQLCLNRTTPSLVDQPLETSLHSGTLLGRLQVALSKDESPPQDRSERLKVDLADNSVSLHSCHGIQRQVQILRELILGMLVTDPTLEPRDILVMCPDVDTFAPLIAAAFDGVLGDEDQDGSTFVHPGHQLRVRLADRGLRNINPLLDVLAVLLELTNSRMTATQVLDFAAMEPVRRMFDFSDDDLARLREIVGASGIRWGFDDKHRAPYGLGAFKQNTWDVGLDRMMLGLAMDSDDSRWIGTTLPLDGLASNESDLLGRFAELVDRITHACDSLSPVQPLATWITATADALDALTEAGRDESWQTAHAQRVLEDVSSRAGPSIDLLLSLSDIRSLFDQQFAAVPTRANFRTGNLTICTLVPMRSVPHRVVCLLGLDDGVFPRHPGIDGDDVLARDPLIGERDLRSEDRQLLLDAVMAATDRLVVLYSGADERTNSPRPPAVPVIELLQAIDSTHIGPTGQSAKDVIVTKHPLQQFDRRNFVAGALVHAEPPQPFSFDQTELAGTEAMLANRRTPGLGMDSAMPSQQVTDVDLAALIRFLENPVKAFFQQRVGLSFFDDDGDPSDSIALEIDPLGQWAIGNRMLGARLRGASPEQVRGAELRRGALPPLALGSGYLERIGSQVEQLVVSADAHRVGTRESIDVAVDLPDGRQLLGTVADVYDDSIVRIEYSKLSAKHRVRAWVRLLAAHATLEQREGDNRGLSAVTGLTAVTIGRDRNRLRRSTLSFAGNSANLLVDLVALYDEGLAEPLPFTAKGSFEYAQARAAGQSAQAAGELAATSWVQYERAERDEPWNILAWGEKSEFDGLLAQPGANDERESRFGELALRAFGPMLNSETMDSL